MHSILCNSPNFLDRGLSQSAASSVAENCGIDPMISADGNRKATMEKQQWHIFS